MKASDPSTPERRTPILDDFLVEPTRDLDDWRWLWKGDHEFPIRSHRGVLGRFVVACKRLLRPLVKVPQNDLWDRQTAFNLILLEHLRHMQENRRIDDERIGYLEALQAQGIEELMHHNDALFARADQKLDRYRREMRDLLGSLSGALAVVESAASAGTPDATLAGHAAETGHGAAAVHTGDAADTANAANTPHAAQAAGPGAGFARAAAIASPSRTTGAA
ncbi:MAG: hypothetical protein M3O15_12435, partial [Acidobacteriota bacterium]|nr:hypothetical protein [Acidobacteriota bacterium]